MQLNYPVTKTPIAGNIIPASLLSPQALGILHSSLYPAPVNGNLINNAVEHDPFLHRMATKAT